MDLTYIIFAITMVISLLWLSYFYFKPAKSKHINNTYTEALNAMLLATVVNSADMIQKVLALQYLYIDSLPMHIPQIMEKFYNMRYQ